MIYQVVDVDGEHSTNFNITSTKMDSGIIILAENILAIDKIFFRLSQYLTKIRRQKIILMVSNANTNDAGFDAQACDILTKFWQRIRIINTIFITPCSNGPKVCSLCNLLCLLSR